MRSSEAGIQNSASSRGLKQGYIQNMDWVFAHRRAALLATLVLVMLGAFVYTQVETGFLPEMDEGGFTRLSPCQPGTSLAETTSRFPNRTDHKRDSGVAAFPGARDRSLASCHCPNEGDILVRLKDQRSRDSAEIVDDLRSEIEKRFPQAHAEFVKLLEIH